MNKLIRMTTVPISLDKLLDGQMSFMKKHYDVIAVSSDIKQLEQIGIKDGVGTYHVEMTRQITPLKDLQALWKLYRFFRKEKPEFVHSHTPKAGTEGMIAAWLARVPHRLHTVAGLPLLESSGNKRRLLNLVEKITYACATQVYPNSLGLKNIIQNEKFCKSTKLKVIGNGSSNGVNTNYFDPSLFSESQKKELRSQLNIEEKDFVFIFVGRLVGDKGINELIEAFINISKQTVNVKLLLVGPLETELDPLSVRTINEINTNEKIISAGFQKDVRPFFTIADALVFPSYREGFPNVVMQAGAMNLPAIVTNINGCNEIIVEDKNGIIIQAKNVESLQSAMTRYLNNDILLNKHKSNAREMIISRYEQKVVWEAILAEYKKLENQHV